MSLGIDMTYDSINNVILYKQISRSKKFSNYLNGEPTLVQRAHETLHHIQDVNSVWDQLETFFKGKQINLERLSETDLERIRGLVQRFYKEPIQPEKIKEALANVAAVYRKVYPVFQLIGEVQAYLSLQPYSKQQLLNKLKHPIYKPMLININPAVFDKIFDATAELAFLRDPIKAAEFVGMYGDFPEIYQREVARLKSERGVSDLGLFIESRRLKLLRDEQRTASAAANYVMQKYQNLRKIR
ncbi:hypothetical protein HYY70_07245 [Candidatus Woesearchaeota archaeon]|nr:hypothetical protein [Candidatus Woesearchaeota archaeon]